ncbi:hypothetical protein Chy1_001, partial [Mycobacterium phage Chy1]
EYPTYWDRRRKQVSDAWAEEDPPVAAVPLEPEDATAPGKEPGQAAWVDLEAAVEPPEAAGAV